MSEQEKYDWMVYVSCMTYNQASYIEDAMNGFTMQETNFPFVCAVVDDASTDGEQNIINNYLINNFDLEDKKVVRQEDTDDYFLTFARHKTNTNCYFAVLNLKYNHYKKKSKVPYILQWRDRAKYYAVCEGDDYWIDPHKLMKQVEALETHPDVDMCTCQAAKFQDGKEIGRIAPSENETILSAESVIKGGGAYVATNSLLYRVSLYNSERKLYFNFYHLDYFIQIDGALRGGMYYLTDCMAVYRAMAKNSWTLMSIKDYSQKYEHTNKVLSVLNLLDDDTNQKYHEAIEEVRSGVIVNMFVNGLRGGLLYKSIHEIRFLSRVKLVLSFIYIAFFQKKADS